MVSESYYLALSAVLFAIGVIGVVVRRNPLVIFRVRHRLSVDDLSLMRW